MTNTLILSNNGLQDCPVCWQNFIHCLLKEHPRKIPRDFLNDALREQFATIDRGKNGLSIVTFETDQDLVKFKLRWS